MKSSNQLIKDAGYKPVKYSKIKDPVIMFMVLDRDDNNLFVSNITKGIYRLVQSAKKISPVNLSKATGYSVKEISLNLQEIQNIMDSLGVE